MIKKSILITALLLGCLPLSAQQPAPAPAVADTANKLMSLDFKDVDIRDAIRAISKQNNLNIVLDTNVTGRVTLHLSNVPVFDGLRSLAEPSGLEVSKEGQFYKIRRKSDSGKSIIRYVNDLLTIDIENIDVRTFLQELSSRTNLSIVPDAKVTGKLTGKLNQVSLDDGLRAIMEGNGFQISRHRNIYQVSMGTSEQSFSNMGSGGSRPGRFSTNTSKPNFLVDYSKGKLAIEVANGDLEEIVKAIADQSGVQIVTYGSIKSEVNAKLYDCTIPEAFNLLLRGTRFTFVIKDSIILIGDRNAATPSGQALSTSELIPLDHIKADAVPPILPYNIPISNIKVIKEQNALLVSGSSDDISMVKEFLKTIDIPTPQVRIDAIIVEYKETLDRQVGFFWGRIFDKEKNGSYKKMPSPATSFDGGASGVEVGLSGKDFKKAVITDLLRGHAGILAKVPDEFLAVIKALESQNKAKIMGQPSVMTLNGYRATINVNETQYFKIVTGVAENYTVRFQPIQFGIQLNITPWISQGGQIIAEISPEVSNSENSNGDGYPNVSTRSLNTTARLNDGQTLILGGLIKNNESNFANKVPVLGDIPILGALFRFSGRTRTKTNLVIYITPHIIQPSDSVDLRTEMRKYSMTNKGTIESRVVDFYDKMSGNMDDSIEVRSLQTSPGATAPLRPKVYQKADSKNSSVPHGSLDTGNGVKTKETKVNTTAPLPPQPAKPAVPSSASPNGPVPQQPPPRQ